MFKLISPFWYKPNYKNVQLDIWLQSYAEFDNAKNDIKQKKYEHSFCQYLKNNIADIRLIPPDYVTYTLKDSTSIFISLV